MNTFGLHGLFCLVLIGLTSCQMGIGVQSPQTNTPTPSPTATTLSPRETALVEKYTEQGVSPYILNIVLKSEYLLQLKKEETIPLSVLSTSHPDEALALKNYLESLPLSRIGAVKESVQRPFLSLVFSKVTELEPVMAQLKQFPFIESVTFSYNLDSIPDFPSTLSGKIYDTTGNPLINATVTVRSVNPVFTNASLFELAKPTDENGEYSVRYPTGLQEWWVIASKPGYLTVEQKITHDKGHHVTMLDFGAFQVNSATALKPTAISPEEEARVRKYAQQRVSPYLLNMTLQEEYNLQIKKDDSTLLSVTSESHPDEALILKNYLESLPLSRVSKLTTFSGQALVNLVFSQVTDLDKTMSQLNLLPFVKSVQFNYDATRQTYHLQGQVFNDAGKPMANASVMLKSLAQIPDINPDGLFTYAVKTDKNGKYKMEFPEGMREASLSASKPGYLAVEQSVFFDTLETSFDFGSSQGSSTTALKLAS